MTTKRKRKETTRGRRAGGHNRGYWFRKGRGWYATENGKPVPLCAENGDHLKAQDTSADLLERAYARYLLGQQEQAKRLAVGDTTPMLELSRSTYNTARQTIGNRRSTSEGSTCSTSATGFRLDSGTTTRGGKSPSQPRKTTCTMAMAQNP